MQLKSSNQIQGGILKWKIHQVEFAKAAPREAWDYYPSCNFKEGKNQSMFGCLKMFI